MGKEITLGQYYPVDSPIHRMDPRTTLAGTLIYIVALFIAEGVLAYALSAAFSSWVKPSRSLRNIQLSTD